MGWKLPLSAVRPTSCRDPFSGCGAAFVTRPRRRLPDNGLVDEDSHRKTNANGGQSLSPN